jgi:hypothetical protein
MAKDALECSSEGWKFAIYMAIPLERVGTLTIPLNEKVANT